MYDTLVSDELDWAMPQRLASRGDLIANEIKRAILSGRYKAGQPSYGKGDRGRARDLEDTRAGGT